MPSQPTLHNQVALVTGASRGIGRAVALRLARAGCHIALNYRAAHAEADKVATEIAALGRDAILLPADLSDPASADTLVREVQTRFGSLDILVNNAGITCDELLVSLSVEDIRRVIDTNLMAPILCTRAAAMLMMRQRRGHIVNISSSAASKPGRGQSNYAAAKGGLEAFTKAMAVELAPRNVFVNAVAPGVIRTEMSQRIRDLGEDEIMSRLLVKRYAEPEEVAEAVFFLVSPANLYITGEILHVDGGMKMA
jgi:3-oxoacyl-[acyl-carrier protein] reductase